MESAKLESLKNLYTHSQDKKRRWTDLVSFTGVLMIINIDSGQ